MYEDDHNDDDDTPQSDRALDPATRAADKSNEFRIHAEIAAVFEGPRKFDAQLRADLDDDLARDLQRRIARLEKSKSAESPILPPDSLPDAQAILTLPDTNPALTTNDYHLRRRPGELIVLRWLIADQVDTFYTRIQAHFDAALEGVREDERQAHAWKQDAKTQAYLDALDAIKLDMADRYLRNSIKKHDLYVLSTVTADEMDILHLADYVMGCPAADLVGPASAPPQDAPTDRDRAWFFKLFALRGNPQGAECMCFFTYLQKTEDTFDLG